MFRALDPLERRGVMLGSTRTREAGAGIVLTLRQFAALQNRPSLFQDSDWGWGAEGPLLFVEGRGPPLLACGDLILAILSGAT